MDSEVVEEPDDVCEVLPTVAGAVGHGQGSFAAIQSTRYVWPVNPGAEALSETERAGYGDFGSDHTLICHRMPWAPGAGTGTAGIHDR
jgi:hypothetical protein